MRPSPGRQVQVDGGDGGFVYMEGGGQMTFLFAQIVVTSAPRIFKRVNR